MGKKYKTKNAKIGAKALKRYCKSVKRKKLLWNNPYEILTAVFVTAGICSVIISDLLAAGPLTKSFIFLLRFMVSGLLVYLWTKGRIF